MNAARRSMAWMIAFAALWALVEQLATGLHGGYSPWQVVWTRYAVHLLAMLAVRQIRCNIRVTPIKSDRRQLLLRRCSEPGDRARRRPELETVGLTRLYRQRDIAFGCESIEHAGNPE